jgi:hypothetical protein
MMAMFSKENRINLGDDFKSIDISMSEGNPGALNVIMQIITESERIDPDAVMGPFAHLLNLDSCNIYGSKIWILYKDISDSSILKTIAVLRAVQLGLLESHFLMRAIDSIENSSAIERVEIKVNEILKDVQQRLPNFAKD